jgi:hypothetical protein
MTPTLPRTKKPLYCSWFLDIPLAFSRDWRLGFGAYAFSPQFIRPTVPRPVNIDDFACFIRPNVRPKPSHDPSHPSQGRFKWLFLTSERQRPLGLGSSKRFVFYTHGALLALGDWRIATLQLCARPTPPGLSRRSKQRRTAHGQLDLRKPPAILAWPKQAKPTIRGK